MGALVGLKPEEIFGEVTPEEKAAVVARLQDSGRRVAMVGDGVNDTAALATALVGVAMSSGVGAAMEVADVVLQRDRVSQVVDAIRLSRATFGKIRQNLAWAFTYNVVGVPLAAGALLPAFGLSLTPSVAGAMMGASSLAVMGNSLLLRLEKIGPHGEGKKQTDKGKAAQKGGSSNSSNGGAGGRGAEGKPSPNGGGVSAAPAGGEGSFAAAAAAVVAGGGAGGGSG